MKDGDKVQLLSRNQKNLSADFPAVVESISRINAKSAVTDGEVISVDDQGRASFQNLQKRSRRRPGQIVYYAFDLLWLNGKDLRMEPLQERKKLLAKIIAKSGVLFSANLEGDPSSIVEQATKLGLEGIVAKRRTSLYEPGQRSGSWIKFQLKRQQEFVIGGYIPEGGVLR